MVLGRRRGPAVVAAAVVAAAVWASGAGPGGGDTAHASTCGPAPAGRVAVVVVVDDGVRSPSVRCVEVADRATGYDALIAAGHRLRIEAGFLCAIDGQPATGCANRPDFDGSYWRYFHAAPGGAWNYSNVGGGGYRMPPRCAIEGWRFSGATGTNAAPRVSPPPVRCEAAPTTAAPRPAPPPAPAPAPAPAPRPTSSPAAPPAPETPTPGAGGGAPAVPGGTERRDGGGAGAAGGDDTPGGTDDAGAEAPSDEDPSAAGDDEEGRGDDDVADDDAAPDDGSEGEEVGAGPDRDERAAALDGSASPGPGSPVGVVLVGLLILALVVASLARSRRRGAAAESADPHGNA